VAVAVGAVFAHGGSLLVALCVLKRHDVPAAVEVGLHLLRHERFGLWRHEQLGHTHFDASVKTRVW
jgi:hypothetical protein